MDVLISIVIERVPSHSDGASSSPPRIFICLQLVKKFQTLSKPNLNPLLHVGLPVKDLAAVDWRTHSWLESTAARPTPNLLEVPELRKAAWQLCFSREIWSLSMVITTFRKTRGCMTWFKHCKNMPKTHGIWPAGTEKKITKSTALNWCVRTLDWTKWMQRFRPKPWIALSYASYAIILKSYHGWLIVILKWNG